MFYQVVFAAFEGKLRGIIAQCKYFFLFADYIVVLLIVIFPFKKILEVVIMTNWTLLILVEV